MDWATRKVLSWRVSNTMHADFCVDALNEAIAKYGPPEIMNTDQGSQFTSEDFTGSPLKLTLRPLVSEKVSGHWRKEQLAPIRL